MKRQSILTLSFTAIIIVISLVIYSSTDRLEYENYETEKTEIIEVRFSSSWAGVDSKAEYLETVIEAFEAEHPNIKIIDESMYGEDFLFTLKADFASGNGPDVFGLWPGSDLELLIDNQMVADLSRVIKDDPSWYDNVDPNVFEFLDQGYQIYSIPFEIIYEGLYINKDLFEEHNIKIPENFNELKDAIVVFNQVGIVPIAYNLTPEGSFIYQNMIVQLSGKYDTENPFTSAGNIKSGYIEAMYLMQDLYQLDAFPENAFTLDDASRNEMFIQKEAAMIVQGSWFNSDRLDESVDLIPFPIDDRKDVSIIYGIGNGNFHMSKSAFDNPEKRESALIFLKYLTSKASRDVFELTSSFVSSSPELPDDYLRRLGMRLTHSADELVGPPDHYINRNFWESVLIKEFPNMLEGKITPEEIFETIGDY